MDKSAVKDIIFGGLSEIIQDKRYYRHSVVGPEYSHWTDCGKEVMTEFITDMAYRIAVADAESLDARAKELMLNELKK